jgi:hypothetical protein
MLAHLRTEAYELYREHQYPEGSPATLSYEENVRLIETAKERLAGLRSAANRPPRRLAGSQP